MLGVAAEDKLATACEHHLGRIVHAAATFDMRELFLPAGRVKPRKPERMVIALTDTEVWLLEFRYRVIGFTVGAPLGHLPRRGLVAQWRRRWSWPAVWKAELSWPDALTFVEGALVSSKDTERIIGLLSGDELDRELTLSAPAPG